MKNYMFVILAWSALVCFSCSNDVHKCQVMTMTGSIMEVYNPNDIEFAKGDSVVILHHCINDKNPCETSIYGFYKGTLLQPDVIWKDGKIKASYTYEKAVFLKSR